MACAPASMSASTSRSTASHRPRASAWCCSACGCGALFTFIVGSLGARFVSHMAMTDQVSPDLEMPMWIVYLAVPLGSYLMCFRFLQVATRVRPHRRAAASRSRPCRWHRGRHAPGAGAAGAAADAGPWRRKMSQQATLDKQIDTGTGGGLGAASSSSVRRSCCSSCAWRPSSASCRSRRACASA